MKTYRDLLGDVSEIREQCTERRMAIEPANLRDSKSWTELERLGDLDAMLAHAEALLGRLHNSSLPPLPTLRPTEPVVPQ